MRFEEIHFYIRLIFEPYKAYKANIINKIYFNN